MLWIYIIETLFNAKIINHILFNCYIYKLYYFNILIKYFSVKFIPCLEFPMSWHINQCSATGLITPVRAHYSPKQDVVSFTPPVPPTPLPLHLLL